MVKSAKMKTTTTMMMMWMMVIVVMIVIKPADARVNLTAGRTFMRDEWFSVKYQSQALEPHERYYFEQVVAHIQLLTLSLFPNPIIKSGSEEREKYT